MLQLLEVTSTHVDTLATLSRDSFKLFNTYNAFILNDELYTFGSFNGKYDLKTGTWEAIDDTALVQSIGSYTSGFYSSSLTQEDKVAAVNLDNNSKLGDTLQFRVSILDTMGQLVQYMYRPPSEFKYATNTNVFYYNMRLFDNTLLFSVPVLVDGVDPALHIVSLDLTTEAFEGTTDFSISHERFERVLDLAVKGDKINYLVSGEGLKFKSIIDDVPVEVKDVVLPTASFTVHQLTTEGKLAVVFLDSSEEANLYLNIYNSDYQLDTTQYILTTSDYEFLDPWNYRNSFFYHWSTFHQNLNTQQGLVILANSEEFNFAIFKAEGLVNILPVPALATGTLQLYPNPARHGVSLKGVSPGASVQVYSTAGVAMPVTFNSFTGQLDVQNLSPGTYIVRNGAATARLVVQP